MTNKELDVCGNENDTITVGQIVSWIKEMFAKCATCRLDINRNSEKIDILRVKKY